jgi:hypothetical protein
MDEVGRITAENQRALERLWRRRDRRGRSIWGQILAILQQVYDPSTGGVHAPALPDLAGDVTGRPNANTAVKIQGIAVSTTDPTTDQVLKYNGTAWAPADDSGGHTIQDEGTPLTQRTALNFVGAGVTATDTAGVTVVTIPGGGGATRWEILTDGSLDGFIWAESAGVYSLIYVEVPA